MKKVVVLLIFISLFIIPAYQVSAQSLSSTEPTQITFDTAGFPQWAEDLRRWEIIAFGTFPFTLFFVTFTTDMIRWIDTNGMDFSEQGRRYAPWPFKSAGAAELTNNEFIRNIVLAAGVSATLATIDFFVVRNRRNNERQRIENQPAGSIVIIERTPPDDEQNEINNNDGTE
ncbi:MAG: hypothetical protein FWD47_12750 [Treponema sp.]|nr:hypothetical protein [Treponema sp.]